MFQNVHIFSLFFCEKIRSFSVDKDKTIPIIKYITSYCIPVEPSGTNRTGTARNLWRISPVECRRCKAKAESLRQKDRVCSKTYCMYTYE